MWKAHSVWEKERGIMIMLDPLLAKTAFGARGFQNRMYRNTCGKNLTRTIGEWKNCLSYSSDVRGKFCIRQNIWNFQMIRKNP